MGDTYYVRSQGDLSRVTEGSTRRISREYPNSRYRHGVVGGALRKGTGSWGDPRRAQDGGEP